MDVRRALLNLDLPAEIPAALVSARPSLKPYVLPPTPLAAIGDSSFAKDHGVKFAYMAGAMANGIASIDLVSALGRAGFLAIYGSAGQAPETVEAAITHLKHELRDRPFGINLIHSPNEPDLEARVAELLIHGNIHLVEASAYLGLTLPIVRYRVHGIHRDNLGRVVAPNHIIAKVSRVEVATQFMSPPPEKFLAQLVAHGDITAEQAVMAQQIPMAQDITAEADSGGHTDNRPALALIPTLLALAERLQKQFQYDVRLRVGAAGGIATPAAAAAAFAMGAAYLCTGSVNQACRESGSSDLVRSMLAKAGTADVAMAPAADMFEMGVKVQVLKSGTMFPMRAAKLYDLYSKHKSLDELPAKDREQLETVFFKAPLEEVWQDTAKFFAIRDPRQITRAESDPRHKMALVFRSYLGRSSHWANQGVEDRKFDFQIWCGPAMGAFNEWTKGSFLERAEERGVVTVALNLLFGAALLMRGNMLKAQGAEAAMIPMHWQPMPEQDLWSLIEGEIERDR